MGHQCLVFPGHDSNVKITILRKAENCKSRVVPFREITNSESEADKLSTTEPKSQSQPTTVPTGKRLILSVNF